MINQEGKYGEGDQKVDEVDPKSDEEEEAKVKPPEPKTDILSKVFMVV